MGKGMTENDLLAEMVAAYKAAERPADSISAPELQRELEAQGVHKSIFFIRDGLDKRVLAGELKMVRIGRIAYYSKV